MWIKFDGTNKSAASLFALGNRSVEVGLVDLFLESADKNNPGRFFFKGYMKSTGAAGTPTRGSTPATTPRSPTWRVSGRTWA